MRREGASLLELLIVLSIIGCTLTIAFFDFDELVERMYVDLTTNQIMEALKHAQFLSLTKQQSYEVVGVGSQLWIRNKENNGQVLWESFPDDFTIEANRWPSFSSFGFAKAGTIFMESPHYAVQIKVSTLGSIRQTEIQQK